MTTNTISSPIQQQALKPLTSPIRWLFILLGSIFVALGVLGIFLPILPTTPFLLLASACYVRSSERLYVWLMTNKYLGEYLRNIKDKRAMPRRAKISSLILLWCTIALSIWRVQTLWVEIMLVCVAFGVSAIILSLRTLENIPDNSSEQNVSKVRNEEALPSTERGMLLVNLGSPDSTSVRDVRRYLRQFLTDKYVIDAPYLVRKIIVECFILPFRPRASAAKYRTIWWQDGSPLIVISKRFHELFRQHIAENLGNELGVKASSVRLAMRYGNPSIEQELRAFHANGVRDVVLVPMYPHYAMSTITTVSEEAERVAAKYGITLSVVPPFYKHPAYISALAQSAQPYLEQGYDHVLMSYHGIPLRHLTKTDCTGEHCLKVKDCCTASGEIADKAHSVCYRHQTQVTTRLFAEELNIPQEKYSISYQSRLAGDKWMRPYTDYVLKELAEQGVKRCVVMCPAFVADCLETLEEIAIEGKEIFVEHGGVEFALVPCLNDDPEFVSALGEISRLEVKRFVQ
ncbi:MAG: ferrochelatase [Candidatus Kapaibacterium sp.]|nr:MAG: ferrochelatase [Candidatus Kapabacteria bacterium]